MNLQTGEKRLNGDKPYIVSKPPCAVDDSVCPKGSPGKSDFTDATAEIYMDWKYRKELSEPPSGIEAQRFDRILDVILDEKAKEESNATLSELMALLQRAVTKR